ncbi:hypothetical protein QL285_054299 [Trifolium repens]|nr:hypothetical protein QL285_054299 [Trifolium repens]
MRSGEFLLALASCYSLWRVALFPILLLSDFTRFAHALACWPCSLWRVPRALASVSVIQFDALCLYSPCTRSELALAS